MFRPLRHRARHRPILALLMAAFVAACSLVAGTSPASADAGLPYASIGVPGANTANCRPTAAHPYPVVLVHGLILNGATTWPVLSTHLAGEGYCVYSLDYGQTLLSGGAPVAVSAGQLSTFVDAVRSRTGAGKVLIVAHSLGGVVSRYYLDRLGGAAKVKGLVSLASPHQGTLQVAFAGLSVLLCPSCLSVLVGSPLLNQLNSQRPVLQPGVGYTQVATALFDEFVIPAQNSFLPAEPDHSINLWLSDGCGVAISGHLLLPSHPVTLALVDNALQNGGVATRPVCGTRVG